MAVTVGSFAAARKPSKSVTTAANSKTASLGRVCTSRMFPLSPSRVKCPGVYQSVASMLPFSPQIISPPSVTSEAKLLLLPQET